MHFPDLIIFLRGLVPPASSKQSAGDFAGDLAAEGIDLAAQKHLQRAVHARDEPEQRVGQVQPHGALLHGGAGSLVHVVVVAVQEDFGEYPKDGDPQHEEQQVPSKEPVRLEPARYGSKGRDDGEEEGSDARGHGNDEAEYPGGGRILGVLSTLMHALAVDTDDDDTEDELEAADDQARDVLVDAERGGGSLLAISEATICGALHGSFHPIAIVVVVVVFVVGPVFGSKVVFCEATLKLLLNVGIVDDGLGH